jgi:hypothetical protein
MLGFGDGGVVGEDDAAEGRVDVTGVGEAGATVAEPEDVPAGEVAVGGVGGLGCGVVVDVEVCVALVCGCWLGVGWVEVLVCCVWEGLDEELGCSGEVFHLGFDADVPVDVVFKDEGGC